MKPVHRHTASNLFNALLVLALLPLGGFVVRAGQIPVDTLAKAPAFLYLPVIIRPIDPNEMVLVPAGNFQMGCSPNDTACNGDEKPRHTIYLDAYQIDKYEVTNARYAACVVAGSCTAPYSLASFTRPSYYGNPAYDNYPVVWVSWLQASTFCQWEGKRLPSEAEWEKAAHGTDGRVFPWGNLQPDCTQANFEDRCVGDTNAAGSYPTGAGPYGAMEMAGNAWEWVNDWYGIGYYSTSPVKNPPGPETGYYRVVRSGSWFNSWYYIRSSSRAGLSPGDGDFSVGFRCAR